MIKNLTTSGISLIQSPENSSEEDSDEASREKIRREKEQGKSTEGDAEVGKEKDTKLRRRKKLSEADRRLPALRLGVDDPEEVVMAWALDSDMVSAPRFQELERMRMEKWNEYFDAYGAFMEPIIAQPFGDILLDDGVPREYPILVIYLFSLQLRFFLF